MVALVSTIGYSKIKVALRYLAAKINSSKISQCWNVILKILNGSDFISRGKEKSIRCEWKIWLMRKISIVYVYDRPRNHKMQDNQ